MPIVPQDDILKQYVPEPTPGMENPVVHDPNENPSAAQQIETAFTRGNSVISALYHGQTLNFLNTTDKAANFNFADEIRGTEYEAQASRFADTTSPEDVQYVKDQIDKENKEIDIQQHSGFVGTVAGFAAGATDPMFAIPAAATAGLNLPLGTVGKAIATGALSGAVGSASEEAALHASQNLRTKEESMYNILGSAVMGGVIGGGISYLDSKNAAIAQKTLTSILENGDPGKVVLPATKPLEPTSLGAAAVKIKVGDSTIADLPNPVINASQIPYLKAPVLEGLQSESPFVRDLTQKYFDTSLVLEKNKFEGENLPRDVPMEVKLDLDQRSIFQFQNDVKKAYLDYMGIKEGAFAPERARLEAYKQNKLSMDDFNNEVGYAMRRGDQHDIPQIKAIAEKGRGIIDTYNKKLQDAGLMGKKYTVSLEPEPVADAEGNIKPFDKESMQPDTVYIKNNNGKITYSKLLDDVEENKGFFVKDQYTGIDAPNRPLTVDDARLLRNRVLDAAHDNSHALPDAFKMNDEDLSYLTNIYDIPKIIKDRANFEKTISDHWISKGDDPLEARNNASEAVDKIIGVGDDKIAISDISRLSIDRGVKFTKERVIDVPALKLEPWLKSDGAQIISNYMRQSQMMLRMKEILDGEGVDSIAGLAQKRKVEYDRYVAALQSDLDRNKITGDQFNLATEKASKNLANDVNLINDFSKMMLGQYALRTRADQALRYLKTYNYMRLMGHFVFTAIPHLGASIMRHGIPSVLWDGLIGSLRMIAEGARDASNEDFAHMNIGTQLETNLTLKTFADGDFSKGLETAGARAMDRVDDIYSKISMISHFINTSQRIFGNVARSTIMKDLLNYDSLPASEKTYLNSIHINEADVPGMVEQFKRFGAEVNGGYIPNSHLWEDKDLAMKFAAAMQTEVHSMVPKAGIGDTPRLVQKYALARTLFQFKGFFQAVGTKVLLPGLQARDANTIQGVMSLIALGSLGYCLNEVSKGREPDLSVNNLIMEGGSRSALFSLWSDPVFGTVNRLAGDKTLSRYRHTNPSEYMLGPSSSALKDLYNVYDSLTQGKISPQAEKSAINLIPFQNVWWLRGLLDKMNK